MSLVHLTNHCRVHLFTIRFLYHSLSLILLSLSPPLPNTTLLGFLRCQTHRVRSDCGHHTCLECRSPSQRQEHLWSTRGHECWWMYWEVSHPSQVNFLKNLWTSLIKILETVFYRKNIKPIGGKFWHFYFMWSFSLWLNFNVVGFVSFKNYLLFL